MSAARRVLVAEDDADIRRALAFFLEAEGYEVLQAADGHEAIRHVRERSPFLVLMDRWMPGLNAEGYCRERTRDPHLAKVPVVLLSADSEARRVADELGAQGVLSKPISFDALLTTVERFRV